MGLLFHFYLKNLEWDSCSIFTLRIRSGILVPFLPKESGVGILFHLTSGTPSGGSTMFMMSLINLQVKNSSFIILELVFVLHTFNKREQHCQAYFVFQQYWYNWNFTIHTAHWRTHERKPMTTTTYCHFLSMSSVWATPDLYFRILYRAHEKKKTTTTYCSFLSMSSVWTNPDLYFRILYRAHEKNQMTMTTYCSFLSMSSVWANPDLYFRIL